MPAFLKNKTMWGLLLLIAATAYALLQGGMGPERAGYRVGETLAPKRSPNPQVVVVAIDNTALKQYGPWPGPRSYLAKLVDVLGDDKAAVIALTEDLSAPQNAAALDYLNQLQPLAATANDTAGALMASMVRSGRVLLAARGTYLDSTSTQADSGGSPSFALPIDVPAAPAVVLDAPLTKFTNAARGVGYLDQDAGNAVTPLLVQYSGHVVPTLALLTAAREQDIEPSRLGVQGWGGVTLGEVTIHTDRGTRVLTQESALEIPRYGFAEVVSGAVPAEKLAGKTV